MTCAQGFCVPHEMPEFAEICGDSYNNANPSSGSSNQRAASSSPAANSDANFVLPVRKSSSSGSSGRAPQPPAPSKLEGNSAAQIYRANSTTPSRAGGAADVIASARADVTGAARANVTLVYLGEGGGTSADLRAAARAAEDTNISSSVHNHDKKSGRGIAPPPGNKGVPVEIIVPMKRGRRLLAQVTIFNLQPPSFLAISLPCLAWHDVLIVIL